MTSLLKKINNNVITSTIFVLFSYDFYFFYLSLPKIIYVSYAKIRRLHTADRD